MSNEFCRSAGGVYVPQKSNHRGWFYGKIIRDGKVIDEWEDHNLVVYQGLNHLNDVVFHAATQVHPWYVGLFEGNYTPVSTETAATIAASATETTAYTASTRQTYTEAASSSQSTTNSASPATFTFNASKTIYGAFLISDSTKSGTTGTLFSAARFSASKSVVSSDQLLLTYTFTSSSS